MHTTLCARSNYPREDDVHEIEARSQYIFVHGYLSENAERQNHIAENQILSRTLPFI